MSTAAEAFRRWGFLLADIDFFNRLSPASHPDLEAVDEKTAAKWRKFYCAKIGAEFMHMPLPDRVQWVAEAMESKRPPVDQHAVFERLTSADLFERFIHTRYVGLKRFSLEGLTALIPLLDSIIEQAAEDGVEIVLIGMSHRGRLNTMFHVAGSEAHKFFASFEDVDPKSVLGSGDVKYHKGATGIYRTKSGREVQVRLASNPSHLEAINPVLTGRCRARQHRIGEHGNEKVLAVLIHGDAAVAGQGITAETLNFAELEGFSIGGTVHIVANNLIGFTAVPAALHSSRFATEIFKRLAIPIFHVNGESPDDVVYSGAMATKYRSAFKSDVVIDLIGYRRYGHNEVDDATMTSPVLYQKIKDHPPLYRHYANSIGIAEAEISAMEEKINDSFSKEQELGRAMTRQPHFFTMPDYWTPYVGGFYDPSLEVPTTVSAERLGEITERITFTPSDFHVHPKLAKLLQQRQLMGTGKANIDWGMGEALAFGSLLWENHPVRLVGQDSRRGTFTHRHAVLYDYENNAPYTPLAHLHDAQGWIQIYDSQLSEAAALGFEYGFARDFPECLVLWEAQFGDFANGAQIIIDQFLTAAEDKWSLLSGVVMLLPHGYEGQGPEHSSARIERYLQLAGEDNIQVCYPSTAAQYFHLLRRQVLRKWRKPLIVFTPKSMLRHPAACSPLSDFTDFSFRPVIDDAPEYRNAEKVLMASGKIVHELRAERERRADKDTAIVALEQFYPFPEGDVLQILRRYENARNVVWVQEEPANMGALFFVRPILERLARGKAVTSVKRSASASPSTGSPKAHILEQQALYQFAFAHFPS